MEPWAPENILARARRRAVTLGATSLEQLVKDRGGGQNPFTDMLKGKAGSMRPPRMLLAAQILEWRIGQLLGVEPEDDRIEHTAQEQRVDREIMLKAVQLTARATMKETAEQILPAPKQEIVARFIAQAYEAYARVAQEDRSVLSSPDFARAVELMLRSDLESIERSTS